jgi:hypothetical protein
MVHAIGDAVEVAGAAVPRSTLRGIQLASAQSGVSFQYLLAKAAQESSFDADATARTSSAKGLFQFTKGTWLEVLKRHGDELGLGAVTGRIMATPGGGLRVLDKIAEDEVLKLRDDPLVSARAAAAYARDNAAVLSAETGRSPDAPDLYLAHFLGAKGASTMLNAALDAPNVYAAHIMPAAARANPAVFYGPSGAPVTVGDFVERIRDRFETQLNRVSDAAAAWAEDDDADALALQRASATGTGEPPAPAETRRPPSRPFDVARTMNTDDTGKTVVNWFLMEELARMVALQPMTMADENEDRDDSTSLSARGFGGDWSAVLANRVLDDGVPAGVAASHVSRAYSHLARR